MVETTEKFWSLIEDVRTCMMVTHDPRLGLRARPMQAIAAPDAREIWFYADLSSGKADDIEADRDVCLTFGCPRTGSFVSVTGRATLVRDREAVREHWNTFVDAWFPDGPEGEDVGMIRVDVETGEFWDRQSSKIVAALKMVIASRNDELPDLGENRRIAFAR